MRLADEVNSSHDKVGDLFTGTVDPSVLVNDHVVIPRGTEAHTRMVEEKKGGRFQGTEGFGVGQGIRGGAKRFARRWCSEWQPGCGGGCDHNGILRGKKLT